MFALLFISSVFLLVNARPDVSLGYNYNTPQDDYQGAVPLQNNNYGSSGETLPNFVPVQAHSGPALPPVYPDTQVPDNFIPTGPSDVQLQGVPQFGQTAPEQQLNANIALTTGSEAYRNSNDQQQQLLSSSYEAAPSGIPQQNQQQSSVFGATQQQTSLSDSYQDTQSDELPPIITKHFYVHAAPEEPEESTGPRFVNIGRKQKNYKIIFIKAPTYGFNSQVIPIVQPNEEKTIVYVLSKKPSYNQDISLPPVPVTEPSKPEVFFIKYKTNKEAEEAQQKIQGAYESDSFKGSNDNIIGTIGNAISGFQNQGLATFNSFAGQANGLASNIGTAIGNQLCAGGSSCSSGTRPSSSVQTQTVNDEQIESQGGNLSGNVATEPTTTQQQQQIDVQQVYLPPNH
ncbi:hypothetical protein Bhyg_09783 [Pseudolycoriella hygida]|uniref:DUF243 domain-containing protein n=1 Tax=Pseudolycoriella hygida TaxID=35572 RepID=A0A9Q0MS65_9DIPT|nr:hypothetical protein Bhyg_09783 [Pseudolycoriella hygida]